MKREQLSMFWWRMMDAWYHLLELSSKFVPAPFKLFLPVVSTFSAWRANTYNLIFDIPQRYFIEGNSALITSISGELWDLLWMQQLKPGEAEVWLIAPAPLRCFLPRPHTHHRPWSPWKPRQRCRNVARCLAVRAANNSLVLSPFFFFFISP